MSQPFNGTFYATAATVVPVLFLALILPGAPIHRYSVVLNRWERSEKAKAKNCQLLRRVGFELVRGLLLAPLGIVLLWGSLSEACAFVALHDRYATATERSFVYAAVIALPFVVVATVIVTVTIAAFGPRENSEQT